MITGRGLNHLKLFYLNQGTSLKPQTKFSLTRSSLRRAAHVYLGKKNTNVHLINKTYIRDGEKKKEKKNKGQGSEKINTQHIYHFANCSAAQTRSNISSFSIVIGPKSDNWLCLSLTP